MITKKEETENIENKLVCLKCGNDEFRAYVEVIIDDIRLYCIECGYVLNDLRD